MVQARTRIMNQLQAVALNEGLRCKKKLWRERGREQLESFRLAPWASRRRRDLLELLDRLNPTIAELSQAIQQEVEKCPEARRLMTHPGVGPLTALAFVLIIGEADRFQCGKQVASYLGLVPLEDSSGNRRRLGHITKQGSSMLRFLLVEAAQFKLVLAIDFHVANDHGQHLFMYVNPRYPIRHKVSSWRERRACYEFLNQGHGLSPLPQDGRDDAQLFAQPRTLRIRHADSLNFSSANSISPLRACPILYSTRSNFHEI
jgi:Transposase IS116/IS110/IS902 family